MPLSGPRFRVSDAGTIYRARTWFLAFLLLGVPAIIGLAAAISNKEGAEMLLLGLPAVAAMLGIPVTFSGWCDEVRRYKDPRSEQEVREAFRTATIVASSAATPRLTRGQRRYVMRRATGYRIGNNRGPRLR